MPTPHAMPRRSLRSENPRSGVAITTLAALTTMLLATPGEATAAASDPLTFRGSLSWLTAYIHTQPNDETALNPDNLALRIAAHRGISELRPDLRLSTPELTLIFRPRVRVEGQEIATTARDADGAEDDVKEPASGDVQQRINEAYLQWTVSDAVTFAYGRQNYQWGAAESMSPSNRIFHETASSKNVLYDVPGKDIARVNLSAGKHFSTVVMTEFQQNEDESEFVAEQEFRASGLIKPEVNWNSGADYFGLVAGARAGGRGWVGEYFNLNVPIPEGLSLYGDASHQRGSDAWYPVADPSAVGTPSPAVTFAQTLAQDDEVKTLAVGGLRYDFEGGTIIRAEYVYNEAGYDEETRATALTAFAAENPAQLQAFPVNARRFLTPGLEVPGRRFAFASFYTPDLFTVKDLTFYLRGLRSLTDGSAELYSSFEYKVGDAGTLMLAGSGTVGETDEELKGYASPTQILAYRHDW